MCESSTDRRPAHEQNEREAQNSEERDRDSAQREHKKRQVWRQKQYLFVRIDLMWG